MAEKESAIYTAYEKIEKIKKMMQCGPFVLLMLTLPFFGFSFPLYFVCKLQKARRKDTSRRLCGIVPVNKKLCYCLLLSFLIWKYVRKFSAHRATHI